MSTPHAFEQSPQYSLMHKDHQVDPFKKHFCLTAELYYYLLLCIRNNFQIETLTFPGENEVVTLKKTVSNRQTYELIGWPSYLVLQGPHAGLLGDLRNSSDFVPMRWMTTEVHKGSVRHMAGVLERHFRPGHQFHQQAQDMIALHHAILKKNYQIVLLTLMREKGISVDVVPFMRNTLTFTAWVKHTKKFQP